MYSEKDKPMCEIEFSAPWSNPAVEGGYLLGRRAHDPNIPVPKIGEAVQFSDGRLFDVESITHCYDYVPNENPAVLIQILLRRKA
jgi:hypothetical protein